MGAQGTWVRIPYPPERSSFSHGRGRVQGVTLDVGQRGHRGPCSSLSNKKFLVSPLGFCPGRLPGISRTLTGLNQCESLNPSSSVTVLVPKPRGCWRLTQEG